ncbi:MAG: outer membrane beta-barrel protein [Flavicella sp.]
MKKVILSLALCLGALQYSNAQISYGIKGGLNFADTSIAIAGLSEETPELDNQTSFHAGAWMRVKVPVVGFYVRPEVIYTSISTQIPGASLLPNAVSEVAPSDFQLNRLDVPVLIGLKMFGVGNIFAGPVFQKVLKSELDEFTNEANDLLGLEEIDQDDFFVGMHIGLGVEFWKLGVDVRYETAFSDNVSEFSIPDAANSAVKNFKLDNSPNQIIVGLSYKF